jgi:hypothetical protein
METLSQTDHVTTEDGIQVYSMYDISGELSVILTTVRLLRNMGKPVGK